MRQTSLTAIVISTLIAVLSAIAVSRHGDEPVWRAIFVLAAIVFLVSFLRTLGDQAAASIANRMRSEVGRLFHAKNW